ncbi:DUF1190 domain-containing protein [Mannheimia massilioguelmaensis]|uniref:DUF1190 domain-containing protein n=1 Tax=Mannheimia massilioguelmaensis TaxID=1604354 RepID=UPI003B84A9D9
MKEIILNKKNKALVTLSIVGLLGGCSEENVQRDVYKSLEDCVADWGTPELCEQDTKALADLNKGNETPQSIFNESANHGESSHSGSGFVAGYMAARMMSSFMGPSYFQGNRAVQTNNGQTIRPQANHSAAKPIVMKGSVADSFSRPVKRGGFSSSNSSASKSSSFGG